MKKTILFAAVVLATAAAGAAHAKWAVYSRPWCKDPVHGRAPDGGYAWLSEMIIDNTSDPCWRIANGHKAQFNHETGCSYVNPNTGQRS